MCCNMLGVYILFAEHFTLNMFVLCIRLHAQVCINVRIHLYLQKLVVWCTQNKV